MNNSNYFSNFFAKTGAKYHNYLQQANAKASQEAREYAVTVALTTAQEQYMTVLNVFFTSLQNCAGAIDAHVPRYEKSCAAKPYVKMMQTGFIAFYFRFYVKSDKIDRDKIQRTINSELSEECSARGLPKMQANVTFKQRNQACVRIVWYAHVYARRKMK